MSNENSVKFSKELFETISLSTDPGKNIIISPLSVQTSLGLAFVGATGETAQEFIKVLNLDSDNKDEVAGAFEKILEECSSNVDIANKIYVNQNYNLKESYNEITKKCVQSDLAADKINKWVEEKTNNKIQNCISPDFIDDSTQLILVNAIYFKGNWEHPFDSEFTKKARFYIGKNESVNVDMMSKNTYFRYGDLEDLDAKVLELPYENSNLSMLIVLPNKRTGLRDVELKLKSKSIFEINEKMVEDKVHVYLPKFKVAYELELTETLKKMGMTNIFSNEAEFDDILEGSGNLKVSKVLHKAFIEVNERGTEASAFSGTGLCEYCLPIDFIVNHPFIYIIWDLKNILFSGKIIAMSLVNQTKSVLVHFPRLVLSMTQTW
uniref:Serpin domain-containing protein n=1 Tax=Megaselia scalaris TaxID=36166 RepID=T1GFL0_MEGSC